MSIDFHVQSTTSLENTIFTILNQQLEIVKVDSFVMKLFDDDIDFIMEIMTINIFLHNVITNKKIIEDISDVLKQLEYAIHKVSKKLKRVQRSTSTATPKNIYLNKLHSAYGIFILEFNTLISDKIQQLTMNKIDSKKINNLFNEPYLNSNSNDNIIISKPEIQKHPPLPPPTPPPTPQLFYKNNCNKPKKRLPFYYKLCCCGCTNNRTA